MAAGKTTLGRRAAELLQVEFIDLDAYIEARYRKRVADLFAERGEAGFRDIERRMLHEVAEFDNVLVATGGGTPCFFDNMEYRPLVMGKSAEELGDYIAQMLKQRETYYLQADHTFNAEQYESTHSVDEAVCRLSRLMQESAGESSPGSGAQTTPV